jgi:hypothetical protein
VSFRLSCAESDGTAAKAKSEKTRIRRIVDIENSLSACFLNRPKCLVANTLFFDHSKIV